MISALANHLWQSTLFACVMGLFTLMLRRNRAAVRHGLWLAASVKFLVPFSLLIGLGSQVEWQKAPVVAHPRLNVVEQIGEPLAILASPTRLLARGAEPGRGGLGKPVAVRIRGQRPGVVAALAPGACGVARSIAPAFEPPDTGAVQLRPPGAGRVRGLPTLPLTAKRSERTSDSRAV